MLQDSFGNSLPFSDFFEFTKCKRTTVNHDYKLYVKVAIINCYKCSFFVRIVNAENLQDRKKTFYTQAFDSFAESLSRNRNLYKFAICFWRILDRIGSTDTG